MDTVKRAGGHEKAGRHVAVGWRLGAAGATALHYPRLLCTKRVLNSEAPLVLSATEQLARMESSGASEVLLSCTHVLQLPVGTVISRPREHCARHSSAKSAAKLKLRDMQV